MTPEQKKTAIDIISKQSNVKVSFNVPINGSYNNVYDIVLNDCNASTIAELIEAGFSLHLNEVGLVVYNYN